MIKFFRKTIILSFIVGFIILLWGTVGSMLSYYEGGVSTLRLMSDQMRSSENYDMAFVGPSSVYSGYIPEIFDEKLEVNSINFGAESQLVCDSYLIISEYIKYNNVKSIVLDIEPDYFFGKDLYNDETTNTTPGTLTAIKPSCTKCKFILDMAIQRPKMAIKIFDFFVDLRNLNIRNYKDKINWTQAENVYDGTYILGDKGERLYPDVDDVSSLGKIELDRDMDYKSKIGFLYLRKIVELCKKNNVTLYLVTQGPTDAYILSYPDWEYVHDSFKTFAADNNIKYWDFSYAKGTIYEKSIDNWTDSFHLSYIGAEKFSNALAEVIYDADNGIETNDYFYKDYKEYLSSVDIANVWLDENNGCLKANCLYGIEGKPQYQFWATENYDEENPNDTKWIQVSNFSYEDTIKMDARFIAYKVIGKIDTGKLKRENIYVKSEN